MNQFEIASQSQVDSFLVEEEAYIGVKKLFRRLLRI